MAEDVSIRWDQRHFDRTFARYMQHTSRTLPEAINSKAFYIARGAVRETQKADKGKIRSALQQTIQVPSKSAVGTMRNKRVLVQARDHDAPLAAVIINARRGAKNKRGLFGKNMRDAVKAMINARVRSVAYIKSGFLPAVKILAKFTKDKSRAPAMDSAAKQFGQAKGAAIPAGANAKVPMATIINEAYAKHDKNDALRKVGGRGLQRSFDAETASMRQHIEDKMRPAAAEFNAAQR
jgi:hypothetical protein